MKTSKMLGLVLLAILAFGAFQLSFADDKEGSTSSQDQGWFCPWAGQYGMGPGMMWNRGDSDEWRGWGPGSMMGAGRGYGQGHHSYNRSGKPITMDQAKVLVENYLTTNGNPNLKSGKLTDKDKYFEAEIVTKEGSLVDKLMLDKRTGWMRSVY